MLNVDSLQEVQTINSRTNYDIRFSAQTGKFTLGADAYNKWDINNNGFRLLRTPEGEPVLKVVPNDDAKMHQGRSDADQKGKTFTAHGLAAMLGLGEGEEDARYTFESHDVDGDTYLSFTRLDDDNEDVVDTEEDTDSITADNAPQSNVEEDETEEDNIWG